MRAREKILSLLERLGLEAADETVERLERYVELWGRWNLRVRLTSKITEDEFISSQLAESLLLWRLFDEAGRYLDVGSGGGLPAIPLSLLLRERTVLVESNYKKAAFLSACRRELDIRWLEVYHGRVEEIVEVRSIAPFRYITARAVAPVRDVLKWTADLAGDDTVYMIPKGDKAAGELDAAHADIERYGLSVQIERLVNPLRPYPYQVIVLKKAG